MCVSRCAQRNAMSVHFFVISGNFWYESVLWTMATRFSQYHANFLAGPVRWYECETATGRPRQHLQTNGLPRCARPHGPRVSTEWVATCSRDAHVTVGIHSVDLAKCVNTHGLLQRHILGDVVQSDFSGSHTSGRLNRCRRAKQHVWPIHASATITCSTLLTASRALHIVPYFPRPEFPGRTVGSVQVHIMSLFASAEITVRPPAGLHNENAQAPVVEQFESKNAEQAPRMNGSSSPFACAMATTTSGTDVVEFCCASLPLIFNSFELS